MDKQQKRVVLAVTGASGMAYAESLIRILGRDPDVELHLVFSDAAKKVLAAETDSNPEELAAPAQKVWRETDIAAPFSSGSWPHAGMIVCPCSMASLGAVANGIGDNLIHRAADVCLKERRRLILVTRETPLNRAHMENMLRAHDAGAIVMPACPGFYLRPANLREMADQFAGRVLDLLGLPNAPGGRWGE